MYSEHKQRIYRFISAISTQTHTSVRSLVTNPTTKPTHHTTLSKTFPCDDQQTVLKVGHLKVYSPCGDIWSSLSHTHTHTWTHWCVMKDKCRSTQMHQKISQVFEHWVFEWCNEHTQDHAELSEHTHDIMQSWTNTHTLTSYPTHLAVGGSGWLSQRPRSSRHLTILAKPAKLRLLPRMLLTHIWKE